MKRREFIALSGAALLAPSFAQAAKTLNYKLGLVEKQLAAGKTVFVGFYTTWCSTCRSQQRTIEAFRGDDPAYNETMVFVKVDRNIYAGRDISRKYNIPRRSTLLLLRGDEELGRIVAGTSKDDIKALMDLGLTTS